MVRNSKNRIILLMLLVITLIINSNGTTCLGKYNSLGDTTVTYKNEKNKVITYGKVKFDISPYHIVSRTEKDDYVEFYCEPDKGKDEGNQSKIYRIQKYDKGDIKTFYDAKRYFDDTIKYVWLFNYQNIVDESGIINLYVSESDGTDDNNYICCYKDETYIINTNDIYLKFNLVECDLMDYLVNSMDVEDITVAGKLEKKVIENMFFKAKKAEYKIYSNEDILEYSAKLKITRVKKNTPYRFSYKIYDANNKLLQEIKWKCILDVYPKLMDMNQDGNVDLQITVDQAINYDINKFYLWNEEKQHYEKVIYDGVLSDINICDGYILNFIRAGAKGYYVEKLVWDGNKLIKESEELVMPDDE